VSGSFAYASNTRPVLRAVVSDPLAEAGEPVQTAAATAMIPNPAAADTRCALLRIVLALSSLRARWR
jgi:hypothetical protein